MLKIARMRPDGGGQSKAYNAAVLFRDQSNHTVAYDDLSFTIKTYRKVNEDTDEGDKIILPVNKFFDTLNISEQSRLYEMYKTCKVAIAELNLNNLREVQTKLQDAIYETVQGIRIAEKLVAFCSSDLFEYPDISWVGQDVHHTDEKTYREQDYIEVTAISLLSKIMMPIWGEFIETLKDVDFKASLRQKIAFDIAEPVLENGTFERIYAKLMYKVRSMVNDQKSSMERVSNVNVSTSFIMAHNGVDDDILNEIVMSAIVVKRLATYGCLGRLPNGNLPDVGVYLNTQIKNTANSTIQSMKSDMNIMPLRELSERESEDNSSILDHASKTSKKPMDVPITVTVLGEHYEIPRLLADTETPVEVYEKALDFYRKNSFDVTPLTQALVASFVGDRFGGSKCNGYLPVHLYQKIVVILQIFLIRNDLVDLAALITSRSSMLPVDGVSTPIAGLIESNMKSSTEYMLCHELFKGYVDKPSSGPSRKGGREKPVYERIDFVSHINRMKDWLIRYTHSENMAPNLWGFAQDPNPPIVGHPCRYDKDIIAQICRFYLMFHDKDIKRPF